MHNFSFSKWIKQEDVSGNPRVRNWSWEKSPGIVDWPTPCCASWRLLPIPSRKHRYRGGVQVNNGRCCFLADHALIASNWSPCWKHKRPWWSCPDWSIWWGAGFRPIHHWFWTRKSSAPDSSLRLPPEFSAAACHRLPATHTIVLGKIQYFAGKRSNFWRDCNRRSNSRTTIATGSSVQFSGRDILPHLWHRVTGLAVALFIIMVLNWSLVETVSPSSLQAKPLILESAREAQR